MEKKNSSATGSIVGDLVYLICFIAITVVATTGILHHSNEWGLYALLWVAAGEAYTARIMTARHNRKHDQSNG